MGNIFSEDSESLENKKRLRNFFSSKNILSLILFLILLNLFYLDLLILQNSGTKVIERIISQTPEQSLSKDSCGKDCVAKINEVVNLYLKPTSSLSPTLTPAPTKAQSSSVNSQPQAAREYYVPFGSGSGSSSDWQDVAGLQAYVDSANYPNIKSVVFEASLHIPTGNQTASVRLYNATDGHPVWNSEVTFNGNTSSILVNSQAVLLDTGNKLYKVQMKTQLQYTAILDQSRLHITTK
ncbi:MAG: hypothetical protein AAB702_00600 [Patescibacteria group bacterium]